MELSNNTAPGSPSIRCVSAAQISIQSLPLSSPPPSPLSNSVACVVVDLRLKVEEDTVVECQSTKLSSVSNFSSTEKICRICHVGSGCADNRSELIDLGCGCKNALGVAHQQCAETWFKIKGNSLIEIDTNIEERCIPPQAGLTWIPIRWLDVNKNNIYVASDSEDTDSFVCGCCEICGSNVRNITKFRSQEFMDIWHDGREMTMQDNQNSLSERRNRWLRSQFFCGFFITRLLVAFIVPWFFRSIMF